jgi:hypothetical protein
LAVAILAVAACAAPVQLPRSSVRIGGRVYGLGVRDAEAGRIVAIALAATVRCAAAQATAAADGSYSLTVPPAASYQCTASAPSPYLSEAVSVPDAGTASLTVDFGPDAPACDRAGGATHLVCPALQLRGGALAGAVAVDGGAPATGVTVRCWNVGAAAQLAGAAEQAYTATTDAAGHYALASLPVGPYGCAPDGGLALGRATVAPAATAALDLQVCSASCPAVTYHDGPVMHQLTAYLIFWLPAGRTFEPGGSDARFESLLQRYFTDVGSTPFYDLLTQYWDRQGPVEDSVTLGGTYVDTTPYPVAATEADPLHDSDIEKAVTDAIAQNGWTVDGTHAFFVMTAYGAQECDEARIFTDCTFDHGLVTYCGYHDSFEEGTASYIYAYIPVTQDCASIPPLQGGPSPNGDPIADGILNTVSHEQFEAVSDPFLTSWYDESKYGGEIGDECQTDFGTIRADGSDVTLGHGDRYILQAEWSNAAGGCSFG